MPESAVQTPSAVGVASAMTEEMGRRRTPVAAGMRPASPSPITGREPRRRRSIARGDDLSATLQPIIDLESGDLVAAEALARFSATPRQGPDAWFAQAHALGRGIELEALAVYHALAAGQTHPDLPRLSINVSASLLTSGRLPALFAAVPESVLTVELTEQEPIDDYGPVRAAVAELRGLGVGLAIDDVGAGYSSLRHIAELTPDWVKLDRVYLTGAARDPTWARITAGLIATARSVGAEVVAEGIETAGQLELARELGATLGQGYWIGVPGDARRLPAGPPPAEVATAIS